MSKLFYFAYGSNLYPNRLHKRVPSATFVTNLSLKSWKLYFHKKGDDESAKCNIVKTDSSKDIVYGVIYRINADEKGKLDRVEDGYNPGKIQIDKFDDVLVYMAKKEKIDDSLLPYTWYKDIVIAGAAFHNFPEGYIAFINSFNAVIDPDQERERRERLIIAPI